MDSNIIGKNSFIGSVNYGTQAEKKAPVKPQEESVTEWQMPTDDIASFQAPVMEKAPEKNTPRKQIWVEVAPHRFDDVPVDKSFGAPTPPRGPANEPVAKPAEPASRVPTTLSMDDYSMVVSDHGGPTTSHMADPIDLNDPSMAWLKTSRAEFEETQKAPGRVEIGFDQALMADPSTAFFKIGMNTVNSIARDGIFTVDGEQLAKPGA